MAWRVEFAEDAERELQRLGKPAGGRITKYLRERLATTEDPRRFGQPLRGRLHGYWRFRVGDFRIVAQIVEDRLLVLVVRVGHRKDVYDI